MVRVFGSECTYIDVHTGLSVDSHPSVVDGAPIQFDLANGWPLFRRVPIVLPRRAVGYVRPMRGGAQAHLLRADNGHHYVVKFINNPQHRRILINELLSAIFLEHLGISTPPVDVIAVDPEFLAANPNLHLRSGSQRIDVQPGLHFGSQYPGDPRLDQIHDFLPDTLVPHVINLDEFLGILVFDKWVSNTDGRQSIFYRTNIAAAGEAAKPAWIVRMIDHGLAFNGWHWNFPDAPRQGLYGRTVVYNDVRSIDNFQPWLDRLMAIPEDVITGAWLRVPKTWIGQDARELDSLLKRLSTRRPRVPELVATSAASRGFRDWSLGNPRKPVARQGNLPRESCIA